MSHAITVLLSVWFEVLVRLASYFVSCLLPALLVLVVGTLPLALTLRVLLRPRPCNCC